MAYPHDIAGSGTGSGTKRSHLGRVLATAALLGAVALAQAAQATTPFEGMTPVAADELQRMRGGFITPHGTVVRFGFETSISVNNVLQQRIVVSPIVVAPNVPSVNIESTNALGQTTVQQMSIGDLANSPLVFSDVVNNGRTALSTTFGPNGNMTVIQNRADNQLIQRASTFNFDIAGMRAALANRVGANTLMQNMRTRGILGR